MASRLRTVSMICSWALARWGLSPKIASSVGPEAAAAAGRLTSLISSSQSSPSTFTLSLPAPPGGPASRTSALYQSSPYQASTSSPTANPASWLATALSTSTPHSAPRPARYSAPVTRSGAAGTCSTVMYSWRFPVSTRTFPLSLSWNSHWTSFAALPQAAGEGAAIAAAGVSPELTSTDAPVRRAMWLRHDWSPLPMGLSRNSASAGWSATECSRPVTSGSNACHAIASICSAVAISAGASFSSGSGAGTSAGSGAFSPMSQSPQSSSSLAAGGAAPSAASS
mmetsp:Transcript_35428/g.99527  ORF Transcript_35428/g.99527 Transcript_35428/m.99527 type:complete len:283 (+) Transcript_35428:433-1281(+)